MKPPSPTYPASVETTRQGAELEALRRMLAISRDCFSLSIAVCNSPALRDYLIAQVRATDPAVEVIACPPKTIDVFGVVRGAAQTAPRTALFIVGIEESVSSTDTDHSSLRSLNASRELWERAYQCPVVFWVPTYVAGLLAEQARDWWRYRSHGFEFVSEQAEAQTALADHFAGDPDAAAQLTADEKRFRIAELEQRLASAGPQPDAVLMPHVLAWLNELAFLRRFVGDTSGAQQVLQQTLVFARKIGNRREESNTLGNLGNVYFVLGNLRKAIEFYEQNLVIAREIGDRSGEGNVLGNLGNAFMDLGDAHKAIELYEQNLVIAREIGDCSGEGNVLDNLGNAYMDLCDVHRAIELYEQSLAVARKVSDRRGEGNALGNLGIAYARLGDIRKAIEFYEQQLVIAREIGDRHGEENALGNLGIAYARLGDIRKAIELCEQQLLIAREIRNHRSESTASWNIGILLAQQGQHAQAAERMQLLADYYTEIGHSEAAQRRATVERVRVGGKP